MDAVAVMYIATGIVVLLGLAGVFANPSVRPEAPKPKAEPKPEEEVLFFDEDEEGEPEEREITTVFIRIPTTEDGWKKLQKKEGGS
jgi:hypothetical protein